MFKWLKNLFTANTNQELYTQPEPMVGYVPTPTVPDTTEKKAEQPDFGKMTKAELETYAKDQFGVDIDRRKKKADLVAQVKELAK